MGFLDFRHFSVFFIFVSSISASFFPENSDFVANYFRQRHVSSISIYPCSLTDSFEISRWLHRSSFPTLFGFGGGVRGGRDNRYEQPPERDIRKQGVLVNVHCSRGREILKQAAKLAVMGDSLHWLLLSPLDLDSDSELRDFLEDLPLNVDADVVLAVGQNVSLQWIDLYKTKPTWPLTWNIIEMSNSTEETDHEDMGSWEQILNVLRSKRHDFQGMKLRSAVVLHEVSNDPQKNPVEFEAAITSRADRHLDSESRFGYAIYTHLQELFNFTISIHVTDSWGYRTNGTHFDGMIGMLNRGEVDVGITPAIFNDQRLELVDFTTPTWRLRTCFLFRHPRLLVPYKALAEPFVDSTWLVTFVVTVLFVVLLRIALSVENIVSENAEKPSWSVPILTVVGVLSQQGAPTEPHLSSGRVILLTELILSLLLYAFYTSAIVTFLLTPVPRTIRTPEDLIRSPLILGLEDYSYNRAVFPHSKDSLISRIWKEKVGSPNGGGFVKVRDAVQRMRINNFAFYSEDSTIYVPIDETFDDSEKCDLSEVELSAPSPNGAPLQKHSPFRELFNRALLRMWEHGIRSRQRSIWAARKPQCLADGTTTIAAVGLDPIFPAHALLLAGLTSAVAILMWELWTGSAAKKKLHKTISFSVNAGVPNLFYSPNVSSVIQEHCKNKNLQVLN